MEGQSNRTQRHRGLTKVEEGKQLQFSEGETDSCKYPSEKMLILILYPLSQKNIVLSLIFRYAKIDFPRLPCYDTTGFLH